MSTFRVGDVVQLKSGGPKMTVRKLGDHPTDALECVWFSEAGENDWDFFRADCLKKVEAK